MRTQTVILALMMVALAGSSAEPLAAATVKLLVVDHGGTPISGRRVRLESMAPAFPFSRRVGYGAWQGGKTLASDGRATFEDVPSGPYKVAIDLRETRWIPPEANPLRPAPVFTVSPGDGELQIQVEVFRGVPVHLFLDLPVNVPGFQARMRHPASGAELALPLHGDGQETTHLLPRGIWEVEVIPIQGFLLVGVSVDRQDWMGATVVLDLVTEDLPPDLVFSFTAEVEIEGTVIEINKEQPAVVLRATLLEPGPWHAAALARGIEIPRQVHASLDRHDRYHLYLPEGHWRVEPVGDRLLKSTPEHVEGRLGPGEALRADFAVEIESAGDRSRALQARVSIRERRRVGRVFGAVFDEGASPGAGAPRWSGRSRYDMLAAYGLPAGRYQVVAGHVDTLEERIVVEHDPERAPEKMPELVLPLGGAVKMMARSIEGKRLGGIRLVVERLDELPELLLAAPAFLAAKKERTIASDLAGGGRATGFYGGLHRLEARLGGEQETMGIVEVRVPRGRWQPFLELELEESDEVEIEARERPAARLEAGLDCSDNWKLPETVSVGLLDGSALADDDPILALERHVLLGRRHDKLVVGPLEADTYLLGLRPEGFDRWSWVHGASTPEGAQAVLIETGDRDARRAVDLGLVLLECGPAVDLLPRVATGAQFPPLWDIRMFARSVSQATEQGLKRLDLKRRRQRLELRDMPRGEQILEIRLEHPWFLPTPELAWDIPMELERGMYREAEIEVEALGGAIELRGLGAAAHRANAAVRAVRGKLSSYGVGVRDGRALIPSLVPGTWRVELCAETGCARPLFLGEVEVVMGQTFILDVGSGSSW